jgi:hypothetical protein
MPISLGTKATRVLKLLIGFRHPRVAAALAPYGFTEATIQEGWNLLQAVGTRRYAGVTSSADTQVIAQLDLWENKWFPIASASLLRHTPAAHSRLFNNLAQTEGPEVAVTVRTLIERYDAMRKGEEPFGPEGPKAADILAQRGMVPAIQEARELLTKLGKIAESEAGMSTEDHKAELAKAEEDLWGFYLEWSQIVRAAITARPLLRTLGFLNSRGAVVEDDDVEEAESETPNAVPQPDGSAKPTSTAAPEATAASPASPASPAPTSGAGAPRQRDR